MLNTFYQEGSKQVLAVKCWETDIVHVLFSHSCPLLLHNDCCGHMLLQFGSHWWFNLTWNKSILSNFTFLCWKLADIHRFVEDFDGQGQSGGQSHLSLFVVLLQHGHCSLTTRSQHIKQQRVSGKTSPWCMDTCMAMASEFYATTEIWKMLLLKLRNLDLQRCCCRCRLPSSLHSCRWGHSGTAGSHSVCPSPCKAKKHQTASFLSKQSTQLLKHMKIYLRFHVFRYLSVHHTSKLSVSLLDVAQGCYQLLTGYRLLVLQ